MVRMLTLVRKWNADFALWFGQVLSWPVWLPAILAASVLGWVLRENDLIMLLLTIQTSVDSAATKMLQNHVRADDAKRDARNDAMLFELQKQAKAAAKRDQMLIAAVTATNDLLTLLMERLPDGRRGSTSAQSRRRANRKK